MGQVFEGGVVLDTAEELAMFQLLRLRSALGLELIGMKHSQGSVYAHIKRHYGMKGTKQRVWDQLNALIMEKGGNDAREGR